MNYIGSNIRRLSASSLSEKLAISALNSSDYFSNVIDNTIKIREWFLHNLQNIGINTYKSEGNFVLLELSTPEMQGAIYNILLERGIIIRKFNHKNFLRITIGKKNVMKRILEGIEEVWK